MVTRWKQAPLRLALPIAAFATYAVGCNLILGTESPQPLGTGGSSVTTSSTTSTSTSHGGGGSGGASSSSSSSSSSTSTSSSSTSSSSSSSGSGGTGGGTPTICGDESWTHWNPDAPRTFSLGGGNQYVVDSLTGLTWEVNATTNSKTYAEAQAYCDTLSVDTITSGWRVPTRVELSSILDYTKAGPAADATYFKNAGGATYWSSSDQVDFNGGTSKYAVSVGTGIVTSWSPTDTIQVRCIHGAPISGDPACYRYVHTNGTAKDIETGLVWQRNAAQSQTPHDAAVAGCAALSLEGLTWRLPTVRELVTLIVEKPLDPMDPRFENKAFPFASEPSGYYWAIDDFVGDPSATGWLVSFYTGGTTTSHKVDGSYYRCVSGP